MYDLTGFHAVITGASSGFGLSMSRALLRHGATVAMASRPGEKLDKAVESVHAEGLNKAIALPMDVRDADSVASAAERIKNEWGFLDLLVNNAGIGMGRVKPALSTDPIPFYEIDPKAFKDVVDTNFIGYFHVARAFVPMMVARGTGRVVNVSTSKTTMVAKGQIPYGPARAGAEAFSEAITAELKDSGITVNVLLPGGAANTGLIPDGLRDVYLARMNLLPAEILDDSILFLASPLADGMTGERIIAKDFQAWLDEKGIDFKV